MSVAFERLSEAHRRVLASVPDPERFHLSEADLDDGIRCEVVRLQAEMLSMREELDAMGEERLHLLRQLRRHTLELTESGPKFFGLSADCGVVWRSCQ